MPIHNSSIGYDKDCGYTVLVKRIKDAVKMKYRYILGATAVVSLPCYSAEPVMSELSISKTNHTQITLNGSNFGTGPNVILYDSFELGTNNAVFDKDTAQALKGSWYQQTSNRPMYTNEAARSGYNSLVVLDSSADDKPRTLVIAKTGGSPSHPSSPHDAADDLAGFQEFYLSFSMKDLGNFPGNTADAPADAPFSSSSSAKDFWLMLGNRGDGNPATYPQMGHDIAIPTWTGGTFAISGNHTSGYAQDINGDDVLDAFGERIRMGTYPSGLDNDWSFGGWNDIKLHVELNSADPYGNINAGFSEYSSAHGRTRNEITGAMMKDQSADGVTHAFWDRIKLAGWFRTGNPGVKRVYDDVYFAIGENANARVELADHETYAQATQLTPIAATSWSDSSINIDLSHFNLGQVHGKYLFVTNKDEQTPEKGIKIDLSDFMIKKIQLD